MVTKYILLLTFPNTNTVFYEHNRSELFIKSKKLGKYVMLPETTPA